MIGREPELRQLADALGRLDPAAATPQVVTVTGDAGIGKSCLLHEFARTASALDAVVLLGLPAPAVPFSSFLDALDDCYDLACETISTAPPAEQDVLAHAFPSLIGPGQGPGPGPAGSLLLPAVSRAVRRVLERLATTRLLVILDDLHAADQASRDLLASLLRRPPRAPVLFMIGYRQTSAQARSVVAARSQQLRLSGVHLGPLPEPDADELLAGESTAIGRRQLYADGGGNPAYLLSLVAEQASRRERHRGPAGPSDALALASYQAFLRDLEGASPAERDVASAAAVLGERFEADVVAEILGLTEPAVLEAIGGLVDRDLICPLGQARLFAFRHQVVRRAIYHAAGLGSRTVFHLGADEVLKARGATAATRAPHVQQTARHGDLAAVAVLATAARAVTDTDPDTAAAWLVTALSLIPRHPRFQEQRARLLVRLARAQGACGHLRDCRAAIHEALRILPGQGRAEHARAVAFAAKVERLLGAYAATSAMLRAEIETLSDGRSRAAAELRLELAAERLSSGDPAASVTWARRALELTPAGRDPGFQASCLGVMTNACVVAGDLAAAEEYLARATMILDGMLDGEFTRGLDSLEWIGWSEVLLGRWDDALRHFSKGVAFAAAAGLRLILSALLAGQVYVLRSRGRLAEAQAAAEHAVHLAEQCESPEQLAGARAMRSWTESILGRPGRTLRDEVIAVGLPGAAASGWGGTMALRMLAEARLLAGDAEGCLGLVSQAGGPDLPGDNAHSRIAWYELLTRAELAGGRPHAAAKWADLAVEQAIALDHPGRMAVALLARAQVLLAQDPAAALPTARRAVDALTREGLTTESLRARILLGTALWHGQQHDDALRELTDAEEALTGMGAVVLARIAQAERSRLAGRLSRPEGRGTPAVATALTGRERQVAELVREGLTNRLIAKQLSITEKTVEMHLSNVFGKLGVSSRAAVAGRIAWERLA